MVPIQVHTVRVVQIIQYKVVGTKKYQCKYCTCTEVGNTQNNLCFPQATKNWGLNKCKVAKRCMEQKRDTNLKSKVSAGNYQQRLGGLMKKGLKKQTK